ncbi:MAG: lytic transglycosylase domain-containing protein [Rhizomicrobium sp.]|jgi:soluble lytic murein transglycosylase
MTAFRAALLASVTLAFCAGGLDAQTPPPATSSTATTEHLPSGLIRQGGVIMMAPISDSDAGGPPELQITGERRVGLVHILPAADHDLFVRAFDAVDRGDWTAARGLADQGHDPVAKKLVEWRYLMDKNSGASFAEIDRFLKDNPDWPDRDILFARAEKAMDPTMDARAIVAWFGDRDPVSGNGRVRLGEALMATNAATRGRALVRQAWIEDSFEPDEEFAITQRHGDILTPDIDRERLNHLLWHNELADARREIARVDAEAQRIGAARIALRTSPATGERLLENLPQASRDDPGVIFDSARLLRQRGQVLQIPPLLARAPVREMAKINPTRWWDELNIDAREALDQGSYNNAYALASNTGLESGSTEYSESEFLAGWIALRELKEPKTALVHFQNLAHAVTRPISVARANYWEGRCYEESGELAAAWQHYHVAAQSPETFYGQLALAHIEAAPNLHLHETMVDANARRGDFEHEEQTQAIRVLADLGLESLLRSFSVHDADTYTDPRHIKLLAEDLTRMGFKEIAVRVAKEASYNNVLLLAYTHPVIPVPGYAGVGIAPEPAYVLGIIRQETEFDPDAVSGAGALGIMQVMPFTARRSAGLAGVEYRPSDLTGDPVYNMQLGMAELGSDLSDWGGSYILAAAAYNAGPGNVKKWIAAHGDPRDSRVDPIDWIEQIPFNETRNYVERVLENTEVYRNRIAGHDEPLRILADLYKPNAPQSKPLEYTPPPAPAGALPVPVPKPAAGNSAASL